MRADDKLAQKSQRGTIAMAYYSFMHVTGTLSDDTDVKWGKIDFVELGRTIAHFHPDQTQQKRLKAAFDKASPYLTRCQHDLLRLEFGTEERKLGELNLATDITEDPASARVDKLSKALDKIKEVL